MLQFLKDRILLFVLVIAGDWVSLAAFIKANEIRQDAVTIAIAVSLLPSLLISLVIQYFYPKTNKRKFVKIAALLMIVCWIGFILAYIQFGKQNNAFGKVPFPKAASTQSLGDSMIVGGCAYTTEAQAEVTDYAARNRTLTPAQLFEDFNYDIAQIWTEQSRDCARGKILNSFAIMLALLIAGITLGCELLIMRKDNPRETKDPSLAPVAKAVS